jgi:Gram-negative bacterial TonB protein C-terminal
VIRERTSTNLLIGLVLSLLIHTYIVMWGPSLSMPTPALRQPPEVEVQLREWPAPPPTVPPLEAVKIEEPPPAVSTPAPLAKPARPPNMQALQDAVQMALTPAHPERVEVQPPERLPALPSLDAPHDPIQLAEGLRNSLPYEPRLSDVAVLPDLPALERQPPEAHALPPLPALAPPARRETVAGRPAAITLPSAQVTPLIKGPASERQVIFQPPPPSVVVESESEIELRFWILPNGAVGRVVPVKKSDPRLEALAINYLRHWRFTPLPSDTPQDEQWGIIPFKFRIR